MYAIVGVAYLLFEQTRYEFFLNSKSFRFFRISSPNAGGALKYTERTFGKTRVAVDFNVARLIPSWTINFLLLCTNAHEKL